MKVAFDENMPASMVRVFESIGGERGFRTIFQKTTLVRAKQYAPNPLDADYVAKNDVPWMVRFKNDGGKVIISGDTSMPKRPHELLAIVDLGLCAFFFPPEWNNWTLPHKSALLFAWVERIFAQGRVSKPGMLYRIPKDWRPESPLMVINTPSPLRLKDYDTPLRPKKAVHRKPRAKEPHDFPLLKSLDADRQSETPDAREAQDSAA